MADKKISELPLLNSVSGSSMIIPVVHDGTTTRVNLSQIGHYASQWSAQTGSANTFTGTQTINGNVNISGRLTVHEIVANYETSSILFSTGSTKLGDQLTDIHEFTGSTNITGSFYYNNVLVTNIDANTVFKLQQATASIQSATSSLNQATSSLNFASGALQIASGSYNRFYQATQSLHLATQSLNYFYAQTSSQDAVNLRISSTTGSINTTTSSFNNVFLGISSVTGAMNTTTSSFDSVFLRISSTTGSINVQSSSQDLVNRGISSVTGSINTTTSSFDSVFLRISSTTGSINATTSSFNSEFNKIGSTTASIHFTTGALNAFTGSVIGQTNTISTFTSSVNFTTQSLNTQTGSQDLVNRGISSVTGSINTTTSSFDLVFRGISSVTGAINLTTSSLIGITNGLMAFTAALDNTYATDAQLYQLYQATASIHSATASLNIQTGSQDLVNRGISSVTGSINTTTSSFNSVFLGISSVTGSINTQSSSQDLVNRGISSVTGAINLTTASLIGITNGLMAFTAALDSTYATDAQLYQLYQATASIHFATSSLNTQTGSQANLNSQIGIATASLNFASGSINTFTGSIRSELNLIEALTASFKAAAIVSSSTQIQNYNLFAVTSSANTFYGAQSVSGSLFVTSNSGFGSSDATGSGILKVISAGTQNAFSIGQSNSKRWTGFGANDLKVYGDDYFITTVDAFPLSIGTNNTSRITIANDGGINATGAITASNFRIANAGGGIDFSVTSNGSGTTTSELLNDYEEGTWTPTVRGSGTAGTYELATDYTTYTKIGRQVTLNGQIKFGTVVTGGGTGYLQILGAPFTKAANTVGIGAVRLVNINYTGDFLSMAFASLSATTTLFLAETVDNSTPIDLPISAAVANAEIAFTITYFV